MRSTRFYSSQHRQSCEHRSSGPRHPRNGGRPHRHLSRQGSLQTLSARRRTALDRRRRAHGRRGLQRVLRQDGELPWRAGGGGRAEAPRRATTRRGIEQRCSTFRADAGRKRAYYIDVEEQIEEAPLQTLGSCECTPKHIAADES